MATAGGAASKKALIKVASATYRKCVNDTASALGVVPIHSGWPSDDFRDMLAVMDEESRARALEWYRRGIRAGYDEASDAIVSGTLRFRSGELTCPAEITIKRRVRFSGRLWKLVRFTFTAKELGFK